MKFFIDAIGQLLTSLPLGGLPELAKKALAYFQKSKNVQSEKPKSVKSESTNEKIEALFKRKNYAYEPEQTLIVVRTVGSDQQFDDFILAYCADGWRKFRCTAEPGRLIDGYLQGLLREGYYRNLYKIHNRPFSKNGLPYLRMQRPITTDNKQTGKPMTERTLQIHGRKATSTTVGTASQSCVVLARPTKGIVEFVQFLIDTLAARKASKYSFFHLAFFLSQNFDCSAIPFAKGEK